MEEICINATVFQEGNGLDLIEVKDDGCGIAKTDMPNMCLPCYTSKVCGYEDLGKCYAWCFKNSHYTHVHSVQHSHLTILHIITDICSKA